MIDFNYDDKPGERFVSAEHIPIYNEEGHSNEDEEFKFPCYLCGILFPLSELREIRGFKIGRFRARYVCRQCFEKEHGTGGRE